MNPLATGDFPSLRLTDSMRPAAAAGPPAMARGVDATLGVPGLPQSATGQTALLTGENAPAALGGHRSGFPGPTLRELLMRRSIMKRLVERGFSATFLNAFGPAFFEAPESRRRLSATTLATLASGSPLRTWSQLLEGRAVMHDLTHWRMRERGYDIPRRTPEESGAIIAAESAGARFSLFEYFETDRAGHDQDRGRAMRCLADVSRALEEVLRRVDLRETAVLVASDHGNLEDGRTRTHTTNPAFFAAWGPLAGLPVPERLTDVPALVERVLGIDPGEPVVERSPPV